MSENFVLPFGKHKGERLTTIPSDYLYWLAENCDNDLIATMADELYRHRSDNDEHFWED